MKTSLLLLSLLSFLLLAGCGGSSYSEKHLPDWVTKGSGVFSGDEGKAFYGVGSATNISNVTLMRTAAETGARTDLARVYKTHVQDLVKSYQRSVSSGQGNDVKESGEQLVQDVTKALTDMELSGAMIVNHYYDEDTKTEYALTKFDPAQFKNQLQQMKELNADVKQMIEKNAEKAFDELDQEVSKKK